MGKMPIPKSPGFEASLRLIPIAAILSVKQLSTTVPKSQKYGQIAASIREVGLIEPPVVARAAGQEGAFILLDGHVRLHVLKEMGETSVICLVATDDESFTYNKRIRRLDTIQEHKMILRAVERGVSEARIAAALNVNIALIRQKRTLLNGICPEAAELLKARPVSYTHLYRDVGGEASAGRDGGAAGDDRFHADRGEAEALWLCRPAPGDLCRSGRTDR